MYTSRWPAGVVVAIVGTLALRITGSLVAVGERVVLVRFTVGAPR